MNTNKALAKVKFQKLIYRSINLNELIVKLLHKDLIVQLEKYCKNDLIVTMTMKLLNLTQKTKQQNPQPSKKTL